jgi:hypothetical protein
MLGNIHQNNQKRSCLFMHFYNVGFLGSLGAFVLLAVNAGQAQSSGSMPLEQTQSSSSVPATVAGGFAQFSPNSKIDSLGKAADGAITHTTATFPVPAIAGHPGVAVRAISPGIFPQGSLFLPLDPQSKPALTGDFALLGGVTVSYPQEGLHLASLNFARTPPETSLPGFPPMDRILGEEKSNWQLQQRQESLQHLTKRSSPKRLSCESRTLLLNW